MQPQRAKMQRVCLIQKSNAVDHLTQKFARTVSPYTKICPDCFTLHKNLPGLFHLIGMRSSEQC